MKLYGWELFKIIRRPVSRVALLLAVCWTVFNMWINIYYGNSYKINDALPRIPGPQEIQNQLNWAEDWRGPLTEEKMMEVQQLVYEAFQNPDNLDRQGEMREEVWNREIRPLVGIWNVISDFGGDVYKISYRDWQNTESVVLQNAYQDRKAAVEAWLQSQLRDAKDRALFEAQESKVQTPFVYDWYSGQYSVLSLMNRLTLGVCLLICVAMAPLFAGEVQAGVVAVSHCTRKGRESLTAAKIAAAITVSVGIWLICITVLFAMQMAYFGTRGLDCPIQLAKPLATAPLTFGQCEGYAVVLGLLSCLSATGITLFLSAKFNTTFPVFVCVFGLLVLLPLLGEMMPPALQQIICLLPGAGDVFALFRLNLYHLFGRPVWSAVMQMGIQLLYLLIGLPAAALLYLHREVKN